MKRVVLVLCLLLGSLTVAFESPTPPPPRISDEFSIENLRMYIEQKKIKHPHIVYAQAVLETGNFRSTIFLENHNLFGMKYVHDFRQTNKRPTTATGSRYKFAVYRHWKKSVDDYLLWQQMFKITPIEKESDYFKLLGRMYAVEDWYVKALKKIISLTPSRVGVKFFYVQFVLQASVA